jgi:hypothetical protein
MWDAPMDQAVCVLWGWPSTATDLWGGAYRVWRSRKRGEYTLWDAAHDWGGDPVWVGLCYGMLGWVSESG